MCTTVALRNIVGVTENAFLKPVIPLQRHLNTNTILVGCLKVENLVNGRLSLVKEINKGAQTTVVAIRFTFATSLIKQNNLYPRVQES